MEALKAMLEKEAMGRQPMDPMDSDIKEIKKGIETILHRMEIRETKIDGHFKRIWNNINDESKEFPDNLSMARGGDRASIDIFSDSIRNEIREMSNCLSYYMRALDNRIIFVVIMLLSAMVIAI